mmetsp:Transcript_6931/g.12252  ORF Transcript_6931/g.12252 Transcript_6931/m.12252 type:complete len:226 (-) Transcript_6931:13-690(-)
MAASSSKRLIKVSSWSQAASLQSQKYQAAISTPTKLDAAEPLTITPEKCSEPQDSDKESAELTLGELAVKLHAAGGVTKAGKISKQFKQTDFLKCANELHDSGVEYSLLQKAAVQMGHKLGGNWKRIKRSRSSKYYEACGCCNIKPAERCNDCIKWQSNRSYCQDCDNASHFLYKSQAADVFNTPAKKTKILERVAHVRKERFAKMKRVPSAKTCKCKLLERLCK